MDSIAERMQALSIQFVPFVMAVVIHEYGHGLMAKKWGDKTAQENGRLTLNPLPHLDMLGTIIFPIINMLSGMNILIGWAKPVPIDPRRFKKFRPGLFFVSFAGPLANFILAIVSSAAFCAIRKWMPDSFQLSEPLTGMAFVSVQLNYALGIFNLVPLPPLDGGKVIQSLLPKKLSNQYEKIAPYSFFILMGLLLLGAFAILSGPIRFLTNLTIVLMATLFGIVDVG